MQELGQRGIKTYRESRMRRPKKSLNGAGTLMTMHLTAQSTWLQRLALAKDAGASGPKQPSPVHPLLQRGGASVSLTLRGFAISAPVGRSLSRWLGVLSDDPFPS
jgi:hypothetical protein